MSKSIIDSTGELRGLLAEEISKLGRGKSDVQAATAMSKLAGQINESMYAELKAIEVFGAGRSGKFGSMSIVAPSGDGDDWKV